MIVPTELNTYSDREKIRRALKSELKKLVDILKSDYNKKVVKEIQDSTSEIINSLDLTHLPNGIGIYVAPGFVREVFFPFSVAKKLSVDNQFDLEEINMLMNRDFRYNVLAVGLNSSRLFSGEETSLVEIIDGNFPVKYEDVFEKQQSTVTSLYTNEESKTDKSRVEIYFRSIDKLMKGYDCSKPLILLGTKENLEGYKKVAEHTDNLIAEIVGNHEKISLYEVSKLVWPITEPLYLENKFRFL